MMLYDWQLPLPDGRVLFIERIDEETVSYGPPSLSYLTLRGKALLVNKPQPQGLDALRSHLL